MRHILIRDEYGRQTGITIASSWLVFSFEGWLYQVDGETVRRLRAATTRA